MLRAFEQGFIFIVPHPLRHGASVYPDRPIQSSLTTHKGCEEYIVTRILTGQEQMENSLKKGKKYNIVKTVLEDSDNSNESS
jgi:hypothetical protein